MKKTRPKHRFTPAPRSNDAHPIVPALARALRRLRRRLGLSLSELARLARVAKSSLWGIEHGVRKPTVDMVARICRPIRVDYARLIASAKRRR